MDLNRIDTALRNSMDQANISLELDISTLKDNPGKIKEERIKLAKSNPEPIPATIRVSDFLIKSSYDQQSFRLHCYQAHDFIPNQVILYFHGGGYIFGLPEQADAQMFQLAIDLKATIVSVDYRLSPLYPFPIPIMDGFDALKWLIAQGPKELKVETGELTLYGASAGGHLAAAVTQLAVDHQIKNIKHQFLLYPVIHNKLNTNSMLEFVDSPLWNKVYATISWTHFLGKDQVTKSLRYADLLNFDYFKALPQTTIVACELDPLRDEAIQYAQKLYQHAVKTELWVIPAAVHVFDIFPSPITDSYHLFLRDRLKK